MKNPTFGNIKKERFYSKIKKTRKCWLWTAAKNNMGYGVIGNKTGVYLAHRYSYFISKGNIPKHKSVCHTCDNPPCVNPEHLFVGSHKINAADMVRKNRVSWALIDLKTAEKIRRDYRRKDVIQSELGNIYGISQESVSKIINRKIWVI